MFMMMMMMTLDGPASRSCQLLVGLNMHQDGHICPRVLSTPTPRVPSIKADGETR